MPPPGPRQIDSWEGAEENAAAWMRWWGFPDATVTAGGSDAGVDVRGSSALAQVKNEARQVGRPALQRLVGARPKHGNHSLLFFSGAGFSRHAVAYADERDIALFHYALNGSMTPKNAVALHLLRAVQQREDAVRRAAEETRRAREAAERSRGTTASPRSSGLPNPNLNAGRPARSPRTPRAARPSMAEKAVVRRAAKRAKMMARPLLIRRRRTAPWSVAAILCLAMAVFALVDGVRTGSPGWFAAMVLFGLLFILFAGEAGLAQEHNQLVDEVSKATGGPEDRARRVTGRR